MPLQHKIQIAKSRLKIPFSSIPGTVIGTICRNSKTITIEVLNYVSVKNGKDYWRSTSIPRPEAKQEFSELCEQYRDSFHEDTETAAMTSAPVPSF